MVFVCVFECVRLFLYVSVHDLCVCVECLSGSCVCLSFDFLVFVLPAGYLNFTQPYHRYVTDILEVLVVLMKSQASLLCSLRTPTQKVRLFFLPARKRVSRLFSALPDGGLHGEWAGLPVVRPHRWR